MADAADLKSATLTGVWVRIPPSAPQIQLQKTTPWAILGIRVEAPHSLNANGMLTER